jgi:ferredoxin
MTRLCSVTRSDRIVGRNICILRRFACGRQHGRMACSGYWVRLNGRNSTTRSWASGRVISRRLAFRTESCCGTNFKTRFTTTGGRACSLLQCNALNRRRLDTNGIRELLYGNHEHPRWDNVAERCLTCGNCTMVCPTCFCTNVEDVSDVTGDHAERWRRWDSCFTMGFSHLHGGSVRRSGKARYRQWMTHKLASWIDQFGESGCVGCGRCITWCPVGIDITEEVAAHRGE